MEFSPDGPSAIPMWVNGHAYLTTGNGLFDVINPATGEAIRRVPLCGAGEVAVAVEAAEAAQSEWATMPMPARRLFLGKLADALEGYAGHFAKLLREECGFDEARAKSEVADAVAALNGGQVGEAGVFGLVLDATRPLAGFAEALAPAVMAGATVVVKPSPKAPSAVFALCELSSRTEWPAGVVNLVQGDTAAVEGLCASRIDRLVFSGNAALGAQVGAVAAAAGKPFEANAA